MSTQFQATLRLAHRSSSSSIQGHRPLFKAYYALQLTTTTFSKAHVQLCTIINYATWQHGMLGIRSLGSSLYLGLRLIWHPSNFQVLIPCRYTCMDGLTQLAYTMNAATTGKTQEHSCTVLATNNSKTVLTKFKTTYKLMSLSGLFLQPNSERRQNVAFNLTIIFERRIKTKTEIQTWQKMHSNLKSDSAELTHH